MIHKCENYNNVIYSAVYDDNEFHNSRFYLFFFFLFLFEKKFESISSIDFKYFVTIKNTIQMFLNYNYSTIFFLLHYL